MYADPNFIQKKIAIIIVWLTIILFLFCARLFYLQVNRTKHFWVRGQKNFLRLETIHSPRGNIRDRNGKLLATNRPITRIYWRGTGNYSLSNNQEQMLINLATIFNFQLPVSYDGIACAERYQRKILIAPDISHEQLSKVAEQFPNHANIIIETHFKRHYPYQSYGSHLLGHLGNTRFEPEGQLGLEKLFEQTLRGKKGTKLKTINSTGKHIAEAQIQEALMGNDIQTTIDIELQSICETIFPKEHTGTFLLMNPFNGAICVLISRPNFDPSIFLDPIPMNKWETLQKKHPFLNRAFNGCYPPGSIFKLVTISAALEHTIIPYNSTWLCKGYTIFGKRKYWCHRRWGHGKLNTKQAVAQSCNVLFYEIGKDIDIDLLSQYAFKFGLGQKTGIIFPEKVGLVPSKEWKMEHKGERWWPGETLSVSIGQSFLLVTPIQIARMIGSIFSGFLVTPRIMTNEPIIKQPLDIAPETIIFLQESMKSVVTRGTGRRVSKVKDIEIYAKTSTAQISTFHKRTLGPAYLEHGWFVAYFKYKNYEPLVIVILIENVGTSQVSTTIAKNFLVEYKKFIDSH